MSSREEKVPRSMAHWLQAIQSDPDIDEAVKTGRRRLHVTDTDYQSGSGILHSELLHLRSFWTIHEGGMDDFDHLMRDNPEARYRGYVSRENDARAAQICNNPTSYFKHYCQELRGSTNGLAPHPDSGFWATVRLWQALVPFHTKGNSRSSITKKGHKAATRSTAASSTAASSTAASSTARKFANMAISTPKRATIRPEQLHGTPAAISYESADQIRNNPASVDEIYANVGLLLLLQAAVSESVQFLGNAMWLAPRMSLRLKAPDELMKAQVDGYLCRLKSDNEFDPAPLAICETKPFIRKNKWEPILRQETAEMACWIAQHCDSTNGLLQPSRSGRKRRLLISQDRHEIYIIIGEYGTEYEKYITGRTALMACATKPRAGSNFNADENRRAAAGSAAYLRQMEHAGLKVTGIKSSKDKPPAPAPPTSSGMLTRAKATMARGATPPPAEVLPNVDEFLVMHQFGPYLTNEADNMQRFVRRVIALMLQLQEGGPPFTVQPPSEQFLEQQTSRSWPARQATNMEEFENYSR